jgi:hypothetical protein
MRTTAEEIRSQLLRGVEAEIARLIPSEGNWMDKPFSELEKEAGEIGRKLAAQLLEKRLLLDPRAQPERQFECSKCKRPLRIQKREQHRSLPTTAGKVEYRRPYGTCDRCLISYAPLDCALGLPSTGASMTHRRKVCDAAVSGRSFRIGAHILKEHDQLVVSEKHVRMVSENEGRRLNRQRDKEIKALKVGKWPPLLEAKPHELIVITADGGRIQTIQTEGDSHWKEDKIGAVYDAIAQKGACESSDKEYEGAKARTKTYVASMMLWEEFGWELFLEALKRGYRQAKQKVFLSDGGQGPRSLQQMHFGDAVFILDWYHAVEHLSACAKAAFGETTEGYWKWYEKFKGKLWCGDIAAIIEAIGKESERIGKPAPKEPEGSPKLVLHRNLGYFTDNRKGLDYPQFRGQGWPIGSGIAEGAVKQFGMRLKGSEKFWNGFGFGHGAEEMLALCALYLSEDGRWDKYWEKRSQPYQRE